MTRHLAISLFAFLLAAAPAPAETVPADQGINADSVARFMQMHPEAAPSPVSKLSAEDQAQLGRLTQAAEGLRFLAVTDLKQLRADLDPGGRAEVARVFGAADDTTRAHLWQFFLEGSLVYIGDGLASLPRVGFYNPQVDGWLVTDWRSERAGSGATRMALVAMRAVTGDTMRGVRRTRAALPYWVTLKGASVEQALATSHRIGVMAFEARFPVLGRTTPAPLPDEPRTLVLRIEMDAVSLAGLDDTPGYRDAVASLRQTLATGDAAAMRTLVSGAALVPAERIAAISSYIRQTMRPAGVYRHNGDITVILGAPFSGRFLVVADYGPGAAGAAPPLKSLAFLDLASVEPR
jgi:hypothetical protein